MSLTRTMLKEMKLSGEVIEQIIQAHAETVAALKGEIASAAEERTLLMAEIAELTQSRQDIQVLQEEFDRYKAETQAAASAEETQRVIREELLKAGANEKAVTLLAREINPDDALIENGKLTNAEALLTPVRDKYAAFFAQPMPRPAPVIQPPASLHASLTRQDVARMTPEEINRNWAAVRHVLARN